MVVGNGLIAKAFEFYLKDDHTIIFASGVSNSLEQKRSEFERDPMKSHRSELERNPMNSHREQR